MLFARWEHHLRFGSGFPYAPLKAMVTKISKWSRIQDSFRITPKIESLVVFAIPDIPRKFQKDPSIILWVILLTHRQTNRQTNEVWQKHNLLGGGKNMSVGQPIRGAHCTGSRAFRSGRIRIQAESKNLTSDQIHMRIQARSPSYPLSFLSSLSVFPIRLSSPFVIFANHLAFGSSIKDVHTEGGGRVKPHADKSGQKGLQWKQTSALTHVHTWFRSEHGSSQQPGSATGQVTKVRQTISRWEGEELGQCELTQVVPPPSAPQLNLIQSWVISTKTVSRWVRRDSLVPLPWHSTSITLTAP